MNSSSRAAAGRRCASQYCVMARLPLFGASSLLSLAHTHAGHPRERTNAQPLKWLARGICNGNEKLPFAEGDHRGRSKNFDMVGASYHLGARKSRSDK